METQYLSPGFSSVGLYISSVVPGTEGKCVENSAKEVSIKGLANISLLECLPASGLFPQHSQRGWAWGGDRCCYRAKVEGNHLSLHNGTVVKPTY